MRKRERESERLHLISEKAREYLREEGSIIG